MEEKNNKELEIRFVHDDESAYNNDNAKEIIKHIILYTAEHGFTYLELAQACKAVFVSTMSFIDDELREAANSD